MRDHTRAHQLSERPIGTNDSERRLTCRKKGELIALKRTSIGPVSRVRERNPVNILSAVSCLAQERGMEGY
jgi:hypothetical protein